MHSADRPDTTVDALTAPAANPRRRLSRRWLVALAILVVLAILALLIGGLVRYQAPTSMAKTYFTDVFVSGNTSGATAMICSNANTTDSSQPNNLMTIAGDAQQLKGTVTFDISRLQYDLTSEGLTTAQVHISGPVRVKTSILGLGVDTNLDATMQLNASALGWCITSGHISLALPLTSVP
jgi:hypothetical protein